MTPEIIVGLLFIVVTIFAYWILDVRLERIDATLQRIERGIVMVEDDTEWTLEIEDEEE